MSSRARGSNKHANPLKASTSRTSLSSLKNHPEPLGPATPGLEAYRRPGSSGSETSALFDYYNADPSEPFAPSPTVTNGPYMPRRPSASSTSSNNSSRIPVATPSLSKSWSASDSHNARSFRPDPNYAFPRSISQGSSLPTDENKQVSSPARRKASMRKRDPSKAGKPPEKHQDQIERPDTASSIPLRNNSPPSPHTPLQPSGTSAGTSRSAPAKKPGAQSKETPLGERRIPTTGQRATKGQVSSAPHTRTRAVTGNAGTKRPSQVVTKTPKGRTRAMSAIGRDTSANSEDLLAADDSRDDSPFVRDTSPIVYRSDQISKSKTSDSLTALARGDEKVAGLDEARTWDDVVIPTCVIRFFSSA